jgi:hypothetical protein
VVAVLLCVEELTDGQMDRQRGRTDMTAVKGEFRDYVNSPKMVNNDNVN